MSVFGRHNFKVIRNDSHSLYNPFSLRVGRNMMGFYSCGYLMW